MIDISKATSAIAVPACAALVMTLGACSPARHKPGAQAARTVTPVPAGTVTHTAAKPATATASPSRAHSHAPDPADVVKEFYGYLNIGDYADAWALGGRNVAGTDYATWRAGLANTVGVHGSAADAGGGIVNVTFQAKQADGSVKTYSGTYRVSRGVIVAADITETG